MTRIPLIAITISLLTLGGCSSAEVSLEQAATSTQPQSSSPHVRVLDPATFTDESRAAFCSAVQDTIDKRHTVKVGRVDPEGELSEFNQALHRIATVAAAEEAEAWQKIAELNTYGERMEVEKRDTKTLISLSRDLEPTVEKECELPMP